MKNLSTISLFIFGVVVSAVLVAGLVFYQDSKNSAIPIKNDPNKVSDTVSNLPVNTNILSATKLDMTEISKHNNQNDCWLLIDSRVYDITSYFGKHPGGSGTMSATCGKDATNAYNTQDPYASSSGSNSAHSSRAHSLLANYYIGDFNQVIKASSTKTNTNSNTAPTSVNTSINSGSYENDD